MRFLRYGEAGAERPGVLDAEGRIRDLSGRFGDLSGEALGQLDGIDPEALPLVEGTPRLGVPVAGVGKIVCIGLNYSDHAAELNMPEPAEPVVFLKATSALSGATDPIEMPPGAKRLDWEVELAIVIGRRAKAVTPEAALGHVAGYSVFNDVTERDLQFEHGGQWTKGKSCDSFAPVGPWLVTPDEVGDPQSLGIGLSVNGETMQQGTTARMIFGVAEVVSYLSNLFTLYPGDIIATGTPPGVGMGHKPPRFLGEGDVVEAWIEKLGRHRQTVRA